MKIFKTNKMGSTTITIFVPKQLHGQSHGYFCGQVTPAQDQLKVLQPSIVVVITSIIASKKCEHCIGSTGKSTFRKHGLSKTIWIELKTVPDILLVSVWLHSMPVSINDVNLVMYDAVEIWNSELLHKKFVLTCKEDYSIDSVPFFINLVQNTNPTKNGFLKNVITSKLILFVINLILFMTSIPKKIFQKMYTVLENKADYSSCSLRQIILRINHFEEIKHQLEKGSGTLVAGRLLGMIAMDIIIGIIFANYVSSHVSVDDIYSYFCFGTKALAESVQQLLEWLSGAPAGLKLNQPLTQTLSAFFSYHVHLWTLYLQLADPILQGLAYILVWLGMCGASIQVAILADLLILTTLHLYCFYVYAARIHMVQISLLSSQWRAFRGCKWNPLKQRVDSYEVGSQRPLNRVLTAVVFTLVIFLLPTTTIYYLVFVTLRVAMFTLNWIFGFVVWMLNVNPIYFILLNLSDSYCTKGDVFFSTIEPNGGTSLNSYLRTRSSVSAAPLYLEVHTWPTPLHEVLKLTKSQMFPAKPLPNLKYIFYSILYGCDLL